MSRKHSQDVKGMAFDNVENEIREPTRDGTMDVVKNGRIDLRITRGVSKNLLHAEEKHFAEPLSNSLVSNESLIQVRLGRPFDDDLVDHRRRFRMRFLTAAQEDPVFGFDLKSASLRFRSSA